MSKKMTVNDIAGFCPEEAVWKMIADVSAWLMEEKSDCKLTPKSIVVAGDAFIVETGCETLDEFLAPEQMNSDFANEKQSVWTLGAVAYYAATGHIIFGGHGGRYQAQHPSVSLPILQKGLLQLTYVLQKCLCCNPLDRVTLSELHSMSINGLQKCRAQKREKTTASIKTNQSEITEQLGYNWPEKMIEI